MEICTINYNSFYGRGYSCAQLYRYASYGDVAIMLLDAINTHVGQEDVRLKDSRALVVY